MMPKIIVLLIAFLLISCGGSDPTPPTNTVKDWKPKNVLAQGGDRRVVLSWDAVEGADNYQVDWRIVGQTATGQMITDKIIFYHDDLANDSEYAYTISSVANAVIQHSADEVLATPLLIPLSSLSFSDTGLAQCVANSGRTYVSEVSSLFCHQYAVADITGVTQLTSMRSFSPTNGSVQSIPTDLSSMTKLGFINLSSNGITDAHMLSMLPGIRSLPALNNLNLGGNQLSDLSVFHDLDQITTIRISGNPVTMTELINMINNLPGLRGLFMDGIAVANENEKTQLYQALGTLSGLTELNISNCNIDSLEFLVGKTNFSDLYASNNSISDLGPVSSMPNLRLLILANNNVADLTPIETRTTLTHLTLTSNNVTEVSSLAQLTNMRYLYLDSNNLQYNPSFESLYGMVDAQAINVSGNTGISCTGLQNLINELGVITPDLIDQGINCTL